MIVVCCATSIVHGRFYNCLCHEKCEQAAKRNEVAGKQKNLYTQPVLVGTCGSCNDLRSELKIITPLRPD